MAVYIDDAYIPLRRMKMCHMTADTMDELHAMADAIGMRRQWFQDDGRYHHYDVCMMRRKEAILRGAVQVTIRDFILICRRLHEQGKFSRQG